jgi:subtilisin family serine protease
MTVGRRPPPVSSEPGARGVPRRPDRSTSAPALDLVGLTPLMALTRGVPDIGIGLIDGPIALDHPALTREHVRELVPCTPARCREPDSVACLHGTFIAGVLSAVPDSAAPAICPDCTLLARPISTQPVAPHAQAPRVSPGELAGAVVDCVDAGARILHLSVAMSLPSKDDDRALMHALDHAAQRGVIAVVAADDEGIVGSSLMVRQPWMIAVAPCDVTGRALDYTNLGNSIGRRGLTAPGVKITSLGVAGDMRVFGDSCVAAAFVTGAVALLWSLFPRASAGQIKTAVAPAQSGARRSVAPPLLDAWQAYLELARISPRPFGRGRSVTSR